MKLIELCIHCQGRGKVTFLQIFSKPCTRCKGHGKIVTVLERPFQPPFP